MTTEPNTRITRMCHVLKLNRSSFYKWVNTREDRRLKICSDALIGAKIKTIFDDEHGLYGAKRIAASLNGCCCNLGREPRKLRFYCVINAMCLCCQAVSNTRLTITASGFG